VRQFLPLLLLVMPMSAATQSAMPDSQMANTQLADPAKEEKAKELMLSIRCIVCQGQSIADSDAQLAGDTRALIRRRIDQGESPESIRKWLIERYGNWITYSPPVSAVGAPLWIAPILFLMLGLFLARGRFRKR
jgi:cytochrome c-type biogenesis protein CcmH